jgi:hypothetical protein
MVDYSGLIARLLAQAQASSQAHRMIAEAKSLRQGDRDPPRADLYSWPTPEQTLEGRAATALEALSARERVMREALEETVAALSLHACHGGEGIPCLRTEDQCRAECGKVAGDAFIVGSSALTNQDGGEKQNPLSIAEKGV